LVEREVIDPLNTFCDSKLQHSKATHQAYDKLRIKYDASVNTLRSLQSKKAMQTLILQVLLFSFR
jgi:hypothetical protein